MRGRNLIRKFGIKKRLELEQRSKETALVKGRVLGKAKNQGYRAWATSSG